MGARGPAPTPTKILEARGSKRAKARKKTAESAPAPIADGDFPSPDWLPDEAKAEWVRQVAHLRTMGLLADADRAVLTAYCEAWGEFADLVVKIKAIGGTQAAIAMGLVSAKNKAADRLVKIAQQFGFSPSARARVQADGKSPPPGGTRGKARFFKPRLARETA